MNRSFVVLDTETTGLDPRRHCPLTLGMIFVISDEQRLIIPNPSSDELHLLIKSDSNAEISEQAMQVNGIDLEIHDRKAYDPISASRIMTDWLDRKLCERRQSGKKIQFVGWNPSFDIGFIHNHLLGPKDLNQFCERRLLDVCSVAINMGHLGLINPSSYSLGSVAQNLGVYQEGTEHTALGDARMTLNVWQELNRIVSLSRTHKEEACGLETERKH